MTLGMEVGLGPGHIVLDGDTAAPRKGAQQSHVSAHFALKRSPISATAELLFTHRRAPRKSENLKKQEGQHPLTGQRAANFRLSFL